MTARILVTGSRKWDDSDRVALVLKGIREQEYFADAVLVHGDAQGVDRIAAAAWISMGGVAEAHPARWSACVKACRNGHRRRLDSGSTYCPTAGHRRNLAMVQAGADLCLAFVRNKSAGTVHCRSLAEGAGIRCLSFDYDRPADEGVWS